MYRSILNSVILVLMLSLLLTACGGKSFVPAQKSSPEELPKKAPEETWLEVMTDNYNTTITNAEGQSLRMQRGLDGDIPIEEQHARGVDGICSEYVRVPYSDYFLFEAETEQIDWRVRYDLSSRFLKATGLKQLRMSYNRFLVTGEDMAYEITSTSQDDGEWCFTITGICETEVFCDRTGDVVTICCQSDFSVKVYNDYEEIETTQRFLGGEACLLAYDDGKLCFTEQLT